MKLNEFADDVHKLAESKGWWEDSTLDVNEILAKLALIHSEVSEAVEAVRDGDIFETTYAEDQFGNMKPEGLPSELADIIIRVLDLARALDVNIEEAIESKHSFNKTRLHRHGGRLA